MQLRNCVLIAFVFVFCYGAEADQQMIGTFPLASCILVRLHTTTGGGGGGGFGWLVFLLFKVQIKLLLETYWRSEFPGVWEDEEDYT